MRNAGVPLSGTPASCDPPLGGITLKAARVVVVPP